MLYSEKELEHEINHYRSALNESGYNTSMEYIPLDTIATQKLKKQK